MTKSYESPSTLPEHILVSNFKQTNSEGPIFQAQPMRPCGTMLLAVEERYVRIDVFEKLQKENEALKAQAEASQKGWESCQDYRRADSAKSSMRIATLEFALEKIKSFGVPSNRSTFFIAEEALKQK